MSYDYYNIQKPLIKDNKWIIHKNTIFSDLDTIDCNDTITGQCHEDKTFDECINMCQKSSQCSIGYYIYNIKDTPNICVPIQDIPINSNPMYRLRDKDIHKELKNVDTVTFINKHKHNFPPQEGNNIFFMDDIYIQNVETDYFLENTAFKDRSKNIFFGNRDKNVPLEVQILQITTDLSRGLQYINLRYGDEFVINIPRTTYIMRESKTQDTYLKWVQRLTSLSKDFAFQIMPIITSKKIGDDVLYSDTFSIQYGNGVLLGLDRYNNLIEYMEPYQKAKKKGHNVTFRFVPQMEGFYCNNDSVCTKISLQDMEIDENGIGKMEGGIVFRNPGCFGMCNYKTNNLKSIDTYKNKKVYCKKSIWIPIITIITVTIIVAIIIKFSRNK